jgi:hypothetical protein
MGPRAQSENIQDQSCTVNDPAFGELFEITFLDRRNWLIDDDKVRVMLCYRHCNLLGFSAAHKSARVRGASSGPDPRSDRRAGRLC